MKKQRFRKLDYHKNKYHNQEPYNKLFGFKLH